MKTTQQFLFDLNGEQRHYLLMPKEVEEVKRYLDIFPEKGLPDAFEWMTGKNKEQVTNLRLEVIYL
jgi:hypothetical protein